MTVLPRFAIVGSSIANGDRPRSAVQAVRHLRQTEKHLPLHGIPPAAAAARISLAHLSRRDRGAACVCNRRGSVEGVSILHCNKQKVEKRPFDGDWVLCDPCAASIRGAWYIGRGFSLQER